LPWPFRTGKGLERGSQLLVKAQKIFHALSRSFIPPTTPRFQYRAIKELTRIG
jgi:hypothetical protein